MYFCFIISLRRYLWNAFVCVCVCVYVCVRVCVCETQVKNEPYQGKHFPWPTTWHMYKSRETANHSHINYSQTGDNGLEQSPAFHWLIHRASAQISTVYISIVILILFSAIKTIRGRYGVIDKHRDLLKRKYICLCFYLFSGVFIQSCFSPSVCLVLPRSLCFSFAKDYYTRNPDNPLKLW